MGPRLPLQDSSNVRAVVAPPLDAASQSALAERLNTVPKHWLAPGDPQDDAERRRRKEDASAHRRAGPATEKEWAAVRAREGAAPDAKLFIIAGAFPGVRDALLDRGWVQNTDVESMCFDFKWTIRTAEIDFPRLLPHQIVNHFAQNRHVTTKVGLSKSLQSLQWFEDVDKDTFFPRSYDLNSREDVQTFTEDFMLVAATNVAAAYRAAGADAARTRRAQLAVAACEEYAARCEPGELDWDSADDSSGGADESEGAGRGSAGGSALGVEGWGAVLGELAPVAAARLVYGGAFAVGTPPPFPVLIGHAASHIPY